MSWNSQPKKGTGKEVWMDLNDDPSNNLLVRMEKINTPLLVLLFLSACMNVWFFFLASFLMFLSWRHINLIYNLNALWCPLSLASMVSEIKFSGLNFLLLRVKVNLSLSSRFWCMLHFGECVEEIVVYLTSVMSAYVPWICCMVRVSLCVLAYAWISSQHTFGVG